MKNIDPLILYLSPCAQINPKPFIIPWVRNKGALPEYSSEKKDIFSK